MRSNSYKNLKILVTGAGGFIASHLVEALIKLDAKVTALVKYNSRNHWGCLEELSKEVKNQCDVVLGDITDSAMMRHLVENKDIVFHLAALVGIPYSYLAPISYVRTNVEGTVNLLEAARRANVKRFVHTSTSETYGTAVYTPIDELHPLQGQSPYAATKIAADKVAESYFRAFDLPMLTIRPFNTYGPRQSARAVIPTIALQLLDQSTTQLKIGSLEPIRDFTYISDTVNAFIKAGVSQENCLGEVINLGMGKGNTIEEVVKLLMEITGRELPIDKDLKRIRPKNSEVYQLISDNSKAKKLLNWQPEISLAEGLKKVIEHLGSRLKDYKTTMYVT